MNRPVGSKYEMVRPNYSVKCANNVLSMPHLTPTWFPTPKKCLKVFCSQITFWAALTPLSLNPNNSVAAVMLENKDHCLRCLLSLPPVCCE